MIAYQDEKVILRDMIPEDCEDYIRWNTVETDWKEWDAPWKRKDPFDEAAYRERMKGWLQAVPAGDARRDGFEVCLANGRHVGWVSSYSIDEDCSIINGAGKTTVGIDICEPDARGGTGSRALAAFIRYLLGQGEEEIFTQTWSGNLRMIRAAEKLGFAEYRRKLGVCQVRGGTYDGLTFRLDQEKFEEFWNA